MTTKKEIGVSAHKPADDYNNDIVTVYQEGPLFVWQSPTGWICGHVQTGLGICDKTTWKQKKQALAYLLALLTYEEDGKKIDFDIPVALVGPGDKGKAIEHMWNTNGKDFLIRAYRSCVKAAA